MASNVSDQISNALNGNLTLLSNKKYNVFIASSSVKNSKFLFEKISNIILKYFNKPDKYCKFIMSIINIKVQVLKYASNNGNLYMIILKFLEKYSFSNKNF